ncbi:hypothetical protein ACXWOR_10350, partial [Streptococcus pyogenes]
SLFILLLITLIASVFIYHKAMEMIDEYAAKAQVEEDLRETSDTEMRMQRIEKQIQQVREQVHQLHLSADHTIPPCDASSVDEL